MTDGELQTAPETPARPSAADGATGDAEAGRAP